MPEIDAELGPLPLALFPDLSDIRRNSPTAESRVKSPAFQVAALQRPLRSARSHDAKASLPPSHSVFTGMSLTSLPFSSDTFHTLHCEPGKYFPIR